MKTIPLIVAVAFTAFGAQREHSLEQLPACTASRVQAAEGRKAVESAQAPARFWLPADMQQLHDPKVFCIHGCEQWVRGTLKVALSHGIWGSSSFEDESWKTACVEKRGTLRVVLMSSTEGSIHRVIVWPVNDTSTLSTEDILLNVQWSDPADEADARKVIASVR